MMLRVCVYAINRLAILYNYIINYYAGAQNAHIGESGCLRSTLTPVGCAMFKDIVAVNIYEVGEYENVENRGCFVSKKMSKMKGAFFGKHTPMVLKT